MSNEPRLAPTLLTPADAELAMDSTADRCALLGPDGRIVRTNKAWESDGRGADPVGLQSAAVGLDYLGACGRAAAAGNRRAGTMHGQLRRLMSGETERVRVDFERPTTSGSMDRTTAILERTSSEEGSAAPILVSFASQTTCVAHPTAVPEAGFAVPAGARLDRLALALDSLGAHAAILDDRGRIIAVNAAWSLFSTVNGGDASRTGIGVNYLSVCERARRSGDGRASDFAEGLKSVLRRERHTHISDARAGIGGEARRFRGRATALDLAEGHFVLITHTEMSAAVPQRATESRAA